MKRYIREVFFSVILVALFLPMFQDRTSCFKKMTPCGFYVLPEQPVISMNGWFSGEFQEQQDLYISKTFGLSGFFIRLYNQIDYSAFNILNVKNEVKGKKDYLFDIEHIRVYYGDHYVGEEKMNEYVRKLKFIQDTLGKLDKEMVFILAPGKASILPEYIPDSMRKPYTPNTNYRLLERKFKEYGINNIDFLKYLSIEKNKAAYPLFPKTGTHWSTYAICLAMDSLVNYIEKERNIDMPDVYWNEVNVSKAKDSDIDMEAALNLLYQLDGPEYGYPKLIFEEDSSKKKPAVIAFADSFFGGLYEKGVFKCFSGNSQFWYYNTHIRSSSITYDIHRYQLNLQKEIEEHDVFIFSTTESGINLFCWKAVDIMYDFFKKGTRFNSYDITFFEYVERYKERIKKNPDLMTSLAIQAKDNHISLDSMIQVKAIWKVEMDVVNKKISITGSK